MHLDRDGVDSSDSSTGCEGMKFLDNEHLFMYTDPEQQELFLAIVDEDVLFSLRTPLTHPLLSKVYNERDLEVMLDSVGCLDHPA